MTVELWYGRWPEYAGEQEALIDIYQFLLSQEEHFVMLANFEASQTNEIDLAILKERGLFLAELKYCDAKIVGTKEGPWKGYPPDREPFTLHPVRSNPYRQIKYNWWHFKDWCGNKQDEISAGVVRAAPVDYGAFKSFVVIAPDLHPDCEIDIGRGPVQVIGLPSFLTTVMMRTSSKVDLSTQELRRIPQILNLKEWRIRAPAPVDPEQTVQLGPDWQPSNFALLVARGHDLSVPVFKLNALDKEVITVGREADNDLVIDHPTVSRKHAEIRLMGDRYVVRDLYSTSGSFVAYDGDLSRERRVVDGGENAIRNHSVVRFGPAGYTLLLNP
jgi:hypothetical protein